MKRGLLFGIGRLAFRGRNVRNYVLISRRTVLQFAPCNCKLAGLAQRASSRTPQVYFLSFGF